MYRFTTYLVLLWLSSVSLPLVAQPTLYPERAGVVDITEPPYSADNTGAEDAAAAINQALFDLNNTDAVIYFPAGTYRLSQPVEWQNPPGCGDAANGRTFTCRRQVVLSGAGQGRTTLLLEDNHPDFQDPAAPTCVIRTGASAAMSFRNSVRNLSIDTGSGNPGANGLCFMASNVGGVHDVTIRSGDGTGVRGLNLGQNEQNGPCYIDDVTVDGFDIGVYTFGNQNSQTFERITLRNQRRYGFFNQQQVVTVRRLDYEGSAPAVFNQGDGGSTFVLLESELRGTGTASDEIGFQNNNRRTVFLRDVTFSGWKLAYQEFQNGFDLGNLDNGTVGEYTSKAPDKLCDNTDRSLNLPVLPTPEIPYADTADWVSIEDFGARIDRGFGGEGSDQDDSQAFADALASGASTIVIPNPLRPFPERYIAYGTYTVPASVTRIIGGKGVVMGEWEFEIAPGPEPLVLEDFVRIPSIFHNSGRELIIKHSVVGTYRSLPDGGSGDLFIEDVVGGPWDFNFQTVYARQFNLERDSFNVTNNGGVLWAMGVKTERKGEIIRSVNGATTEVLGAFHYATSEEEAVPEPIYTVSESSFSAAGVKELTYINDAYDIKLRETRNGQTVELRNPDVELRSALLVAYVDDSQPSTPPTVVAADDQTVMLSQGTTTLSATVEDDGRPSGNCFAVTNWEQVEGPPTATIADTGARTTEVTFTEAGRYVYRLTADDGAAEASDELTIFVADLFTDTRDHDQDSIPSGNGADAFAQGSNNFRTNYGDRDIIAAKNFNFPQKSIVRIDRSAFADRTVDAARFEVEIATTNSGLIEDWTYNVFGLNDGDPGEAWSENAVTYENLPANAGDFGGAYDPEVPESGGIDHTQATFLGTFTTRRRRRESVGMSTDALSDFINADTDGQLSFLITRVDVAQNVIGFASKENVEFAPPRLYVDLSNDVAAPVSLTDFRIVTDGFDANLSWAVRQETDFSHYEVQRTANDAAWTTIGSVEGGAAKYALRDPGVGQHYARATYRLRMVDLDGTINYSPLRVATFPDRKAAPEEEGIYPNPFSRMLTLTSRKAQSISVSSTDGRHLRTLHHPGGGARRFALSVEPGLYIFRFLTSGKTVRTVAL